MTRLHCPITMRLFTDPVKASDGNTYEREAIIDWLARNGTIPETGTVLRTDDLRPDTQALQAVQKFRNECQKRQYQFRLGEDIHGKTKNGSRRGLHMIYYAAWKFHGPPIVLTELENLRTTRDPLFYREKTSYPYLVKIYGIIRRSSPLLLVQETATMGDFASLLPTMPTLSTATLKVIFRQITEAMIFCQCIHGNLSCESVLVYRIDNNVPPNTLVKLTDFGLCEDRQHRWFERTDGTKMQSRISIRHMAPELCGSQPRRIYTEKTDAYAMGVLMWQGWSKGRLPWNEIAEDQEVGRQVLKGVQLKKPKSCSDDDWKRIVQPCLALNPQHRPSFSHLHQQICQESKARKEEPVRRKRVLQPRPKASPNPSSLTDEASFDDEPRSRSHFCQCSKWRCGIVLIVLGVLIIGAGIGVGFIFGLRKKSDPIDETTSIVFPTTTSFPQTFTFPITTTTTTTVTMTTRSSSTATPPAPSPCPPVLSAATDSRVILSLNPTITMEAYTNYSYDYTSSSSSRNAMILFDFVMEWGSWYLDDVSIRDLSTGQELIENNGFETGQLLPKWQYCNGYFSWIKEGIVSKEFCRQGNFCFQSAIDQGGSSAYLAQTINIVGNRKYRIEFHLFFVGDPIEATVTLVSS